LFSSFTFWYYFLFFIWLDLYYNLLILFLLLLFYIFAILIKLNATILIIFVLILDIICNIAVDIYHLRLIIISNITIPILLTHFPLPTHIKLVQIQNRRQNCQRFILRTTFKIMLIMMGKFITLIKLFNFTLLFT